MNVLDQKDDQRMTLQLEIFVDRPTNGLLGQSLVSEHTLAQIKKKKLLFRSPFVK